MLAALTAAALLGACATRAPAPSQPLPAPAPVVEAKPPPPAPPPMPLGLYLERLRALPADALGAESQAQLAQASQGDARARLFAALALVQPQHPARDDARAYALADQVAQDAAQPPPLRDLAGVVALWIDEQRRAEQASRRAQAKQREDEARQQATEQRLRDTEKRAQDAEKKLEALRAIERDLSGRGSHGRQ